MSELYLLITTLFIMTLPPWHYELSHGELPPIVNMHHIYHQCRYFEYNSIPCINIYNVLDPLSLTTNCLHSTPFFYIWTALLSFIMCVYINILHWLTTFKTYVLYNKLKCCIQPAIYLNYSNWHTIYIRICTITCCKSIAKLLVCL